MTDEEIIAELKKEPAAELRRLQRMPYEWKVEHAIDVIREFVEHEGVNGIKLSPMYTEGGMRRTGCIILTDR